MRWVILTDDPPGYPGGVAAFADRVSGELANRGDEVTVFGRDRAGARAPPGVRFVPVRGPSFGRWGGAWLGLRAARAIAQADRVLATTWTVATWAARIRTGIHLVAHGSDVTRPPMRPRGFTRVWHGARPWAMSAFLADRLAGLGVAATVLPAPVDVAARPRAAGDGSRWAYVARAIDEKGGDRFVRMCGAAAVRGVVVGDGPARSRWEELAFRLGTDVRFTGTLPARRVREVLQESDLVVLLPRGPEGLGLALIEGAALGVAAVGCPAGGVAEAVGPGLVLDDPDDAAASAAAIHAWWRDDRGAEAWAWCRATHGTARTVDALATDQSAAAAAHVGTAMSSASARNAS